MGHVPIPAEELSLGLRKTNDTLPELQIAIHDELQFRITTPTLFAPLVLFGASMAPGPIQYDLKARVKDPDAFLDFLENAQIGAYTNVTLIPSEITARLISADEIALRPEHTSPA